jgi:hypothetical protein
MYLVTMGCVWVTPEHPYQPYSFSPNQSITPAELKYSDIGVYYAGNDSFKIGNKYLSELVEKHEEYVKLVGNVKWLQRYKKYIPKLTAAISNSKKMKEAARRVDKNRYLKKSNDLKLQNKVLREWKDKLARLKTKYSFKRTDSIDRMIERLNRRKNQVQKEINILESRKKDDDLQKRLLKLQK